MPPSPNDIQAEPPEPTRPYEPEIAPCPHCGEPVASLCLVCPHCERTIPRSRPDAPIDWDRRKRRTRSKIWLGSVGVLAHLALGQLIFANHWSPGPTAFVFCLLMVLIGSGSTIGLLTSEPTPGNWHSWIAHIVGWYCVASGIIV